MELISIICPTKNRIHQVLELLDSISNTASLPEFIEILFYIDYEDNKTKNEIDGLKIKYKMRIDHTSSKEITDNLSEMFNYTYNVLSKGDIIMLTGDDCRFRTKHWDKTIRETFNLYPDKIVLVYGDDGINHQKLATHPFLSRKWIEISGFWLPSYFHCDYVDTWVDDVARMIKRIHYLPNVLFEHMHPNVGKSKPDDVTIAAIKKREKYNPMLKFEQTKNERIDQSLKLLNYINTFN